MSDQQSNPNQLTLLDAYLCSKCCQLHIISDPIYRHHLEHRYLRGIGKLRIPSPQHQSPNDDPGTEKQSTPKKKKRRATTTK